MSDRYTPFRPPGEEGAAQTYFEGYLRRFRVFNAGLLQVGGVAQWILLAVLGGSDELTFLLTLGILLYSIWVKTSRPSWSCACTAFTFPIMAQSLLFKTGGHLNLYLAGLAFVALTRELNSLAGFLLGALVGLALKGDSLSGASGDALFWSWAAFLLIFSIVVCLVTRAELWTVSIEQVELQAEMESSNAHIAASERERTSRLQSLLDEVLDFCRGVAASGHNLYDMGQRQEAGNRQVIRATEEILASTESVLRDCLASGDALVLLQSRTRESLNIAHLGETGVNHGGELLQSIQSAASLVCDRLRVILGRNEQVLSLVKSIRKTAERVRVVSLHAAMEAERTTSTHHNFGYVADEIRGLGNRLDVSALNVERILRGVEERVNGNLRSLENFQAQLVGNLRLLGEVSQCLQATHAHLSEAEMKLHEGNGLLRRQEHEVRQMQDCTREMEGRQQSGEAARLELQAVLSHLSNTLEQVSWAAAELG